MRKFVSFLYKNIFNKEVIKVFNKLQPFKNVDTSLKHQYQLEKLAATVKVLKEIPFYKDRVIIDPENFSYRSFSEIPLLTKEIIRNSANELVNTKFDKSQGVRKNTSGGSTGEPVVFYRTKQHDVHGGANYFFANYLNGVDIYDYSVDLWGAERDMHKVDRGFDLSSFVHNKLMLNTFVMSDDIIEKYIVDLNRTRPKFIKAYVHSIYDIAKYINRHGIKIKFTPVIHCTTGPLYPEMRREIKQAFNDSHVYSFYGSREVSAMATETLSESGFEVLFDNVFIEILDSDGQPVQRGQEGEIVVTTLNNHYMPLVRYKIGDRAIKGDDLEFGTLRIENIVGRTLGVIHTEDGRKIDGQFFTTLFFHKEGIQGFQLVQISISKLILNLVKGDHFNVEELNSILSRIKNELGDVEIEVVFCEKLTLTKSGKLMYVYSELSKS